MTNTTIQATQQAAEQHVDSAERGMIFAFRKAAGESMKYVKHWYLSAAISYDEILDDWNGKMERIWNKAPSQDAREAFRQTLAKHNNGLIIHEN